MSMLLRNDYRNGGEGFILWAEENANVQIVPIGSTQKIWVPLGDLPNKKHPETGRSYRDMWEEQKEILVEALAMCGGFFKYNLVVFNWMRGDGKSFLACLIVIWRICCWVDQMIALGANSEKQTKFVHYEEILKIVRNSPNILAEIGQDNILEKELRMKDDSGNIRSYIRPVSAYSGLFPNINCFTFSEMFLMQNEKFFTQLYGSIRNVPNAMGLIDTTVSGKNHVLYRMWVEFTKNMDDADNMIYYSYRCSEKPDPADFFHPNMTSKQLKSFKSTFLKSEFNRYFKNTWSSGAEKYFEPEIVEGTRFVGVDNRSNTQETLIQLLKHKNDLIQNTEYIKKKGITDTRNFSSDIRKIYSRLWPVNDIYTLSSAQGESIFATANAIENLSDIYDTDWAILAGLDRADPAKRQDRSAARTVTCVIAKGLRGSRSNPTLGDVDTPSYIYFMLGIKNIESHSLEDIKSFFKEGYELYDGINTIGSERYAAWDLAPWCDDNDIVLKLWQTSYNIQRAMFYELYLSMRDGRFKSPPVPIVGQKEDDVFKEEAENFDHDDERRWFGSPEKKEVNGVQDDAIFAIGAALYAGAELTVNDFSARKGKIDFGIFFNDPRLLGDYGART